MLLLLTQSVFDQDMMPTNAKQQWLKGSKIAWMSVGWLLFKHISKLSLTPLAE